MLDIWPRMGTLSGDKNTAMKLTLYLQLHRGKYRVRIVVPEHLREVLQQTALLQPLGTADLREAADRKWPYVAKFKALLAEAEKALQTDDPLRREALQQRIYVQRGDREYDAGDGEVYIVNDDADWAEERAYQIEREHGSVAAHRYAKIALGRETPLTQYVDPSSQDRDITDGTKAELLRALDWIDGWLVGEGKANSLEAVDRKTASEFLRGKLQQDRGPKRVKVYLSALRTYWEWMIEAGYFVGENPWAGLRVRQSKHEAHARKPPRPFTDEEVATLLSTPAPDDLGFTMRVAALSGMRISEIMGRTLSQCEGGLFVIPAGKTFNAKRTFPIHEDLQVEIDRRLAAHRPSDPLVWSEAKRPADSMGKAFGRFRRKLDIGAQKGTARDRSEVNFHSFRRWFVDKVRDAKRSGAQGFDDAILATVVGHADDGPIPNRETMARLYEGRNKHDAQRALLAAVKLPEGVPPLPQHVRPPRRRRPT